MSWLLLAKAKARRCSELFNESKLWTRGSTMESYQPTIQTLRCVSKRQANSRIRPKPVVQERGRDPNPRAVPFAASASKPAFLHDLLPPVFTLPSEGTGAKPVVKSSDSWGEGSQGERDELDSVQKPATPFPKPGEKGSQVPTGSLSDWSWLDKRTLAHDIKTAAREAHKDYGMGEVRLLCPSGGQGRQDDHWRGRSPHRPPSGATGQHEMLGIVDAVRAQRARLQVSGVEQPRDGPEYFRDVGAPPIQPPVSLAREAQVREDPWTTGPDPWSAGYQAGRSRDNPPSPRGVVLGTVLEDEEYLRPSDSLLLRRSGNAMRGGASGSGSTDYRRGWSSGAGSGHGRLDLLRGGAGADDASSDAMAVPAAALPVDRILGGFAQALAPVAENIGRALAVIADGARGQRRSDWDRRFKLETKLPRVAGDSNRSIILETDELEKTLIRAGVNNWEDFYRYFDAQL